MLKTRTAALGTLLAVTTLSPVPAAADVVPFFSGLYGGVSGMYTNFNSRSTDSRTGYRLYGGFDMAGVPGVVRVGLEGGYTETGRFNTPDGPERLENWDLGVQGTLTTLPVLDLHGRLGLEWGDTSGTFYALGLTAAFLPLASLRAEYQDRNGFDGYFLGIQLRIP